LKNLFIIRFLPPPLSSPVYQKSINGEDYT
jgi:hypothetical protein